MDQSGFVFQSLFILKKDINKTKLIIGELFFILLSFTILLWIGYLWINNIHLLIGFLSCQAGITFSFLYLVKSEKVRFLKMEQILLDIIKSESSINEDEIIVDFDGEKYEVSKGDEEDQSDADFLENEYQELLERERKSKEKPNPYDPEQFL